MKQLLLIFLLFSSVFSKSQRTLGLLTQTAGSRQGYVLFAPLNSTNTYLIDKCGKLVHQWNSNYTPGQSAYLLPNGHLLRTADDSNKVFHTSGGRVELYDWNSSLLWSYVISDSLRCMHHDVYPLPNGNILALVWEKKTRAEAIAAGRNPALLGACLWSEKIIEIKPKGTNGAKKVWEWSVWDHLIQDFDSSKANYGKVADHPERIDINFLASEDMDWLHFNSLAFNAALNQILVSNRNHSEFFIIDHSASTKQAATNKGGKQNKGGDILYRWGNPRAYASGGIIHQQLFKQHSAEWIAKGLPDEGKIIVFNNGLERPDSMYSTVDVIDPPITKNGGYARSEGSAFLPLIPYWQYRAPKASHFFSKNVSGAQRLSNGNTLICSGFNGKFFELDSAKNVVWLYINPVNLQGTHAQGESIMDNRCFRCVFYEPDYSGFKNKSLSPGKPIETGDEQYPCLMVSPEPKSHK